MPILPTQSTLPHTGAVIAMFIFFDDDGIPIKPFHVYDVNYVNRVGKRPSCPPSPPYPSQALS